MSYFKPTWLYIKTHNQTGLQYLGKTTEKNPHEYEGSGIHWIRHIKKHGNDISTFIIGYYTDETECRRVALFYSWFYDVVESNDWANLKHETLDGGSYSHSEETNQKIREKALARVTLGKHNFSKREDGSSLASDRVRAGTNPFQSRFDGSSVGRDSVIAQVERGIHPWLKKNKVKKECPVCHRWFTDASFVRWHGDKCGKPVTKKECPHCHQLISENNFNRWHGDRCKQNPNREEFK